MHKEIAMQLSTALRSGDYKQGRDELRTTTLDGHTLFCCLGVLCNLHAQAHPDIAKFETQPGVYLGEDTSLPSHVMGWADIKYADGGLRSKAPLKIGGRDMASLADANDSGVSFKEIADFIEKNYENL